MLRILNIASVLLFTAFLLLPLGCLAILGPVNPYGQKPFTQFPIQLSKVFKSSEAARQALTSALFERSQATFHAIRMRNHFLYHYVGYIDNKRIVSGQDGWLFLKHQFWGGKCFSDAHFMRSLNTVDTLAALSEAAGLPLTFTISPDKVSVHPEKLHRRAESYVGCKLQNGRRWRQLAYQYAPGLVDHTAAILDSKDPHLNYYFSTDTHWNSKGIELALAQLFTVVGGRAAAGSATSLHSMPRARRTDLRNNMLLLDDLEENANTVAIWKAKESSYAILFIHDSFYQQARKALAAAFPKADFYHIARDTDAYSDAIQKHSGALVVNSVERVFFSRFRNDRVIGIGPAIIQRNMSKARFCHFGHHVNLGKSGIFHNIRRIGNSYQATSRDPIVIIPILGVSSNCLRIALEVPKDGVFELFFPPLEGRRHRANFEAGRSLSLPLAAGRHVLQFVLPSNRKKNILRIDPTSAATTFSILDVSFGSLP